MFSSKSTTKKNSKDVNLRSFFFFSLGIPFGQRTSHSSYAPPSRAAPGIEPGTSRTLSEDTTSRHLCITYKTSRQGQARCVACHRTLRGVVESHLKHLPFSCFVSSRIVSSRLCVSRLFSSPLHSPLPLTSSLLLLSSPSRLCSSRHVVFSSPRR